MAARLYLGVGVHVFAALRAAIPFAEIDETGTRFVTAF
jgi:hypothetical protein